MSSSGGRAELFVKCRLWLMVLLQKPSTAVEYLAAHLSKIHGLDWHPDSEHILATSSQDNSVKVSGAAGAGWGACLGASGDFEHFLWKESCRWLAWRVFQGVVCFLGSRAGSLVMWTRGAVK